MRHYLSRKPFNIFILQEIITESMCIAKDTQLTIGAIRLLLSWVISFLYQRYNFSTHEKFLFKRKWNTERDSMDATACNIFYTYLISLLSLKHMSEHVWILFSLICFEDVVCELLKLIRKIEKKKSVKLIFVLLLLLLGFFVCCALVEGFNSSLIWNFFFWWTLVALKVSEKIVNTFLNAYVFNFFLKRVGNKLC